MSTDYDTGLTSIAALRTYRQDILRHTGAAPATVALTDLERRELGTDMWLHHPLALKGYEMEVPIGTKILGMTVVAAPALVEAAEPQEPRTGTISGPGYEAL